MARYTCVERWRVLRDWSNYSISNRGRVKRITPASGTWVGRILRHTLRNGYPTVELFQDGIGQSLSVHRLVAIAFLLNDSEFPEVNHKDGDRLNPRLSNLEWATFTANTQHAVGMGALNHPHHGAKHIYPHYGGQWRVIIQGVHHGTFKTQHQARAKRRAILEAKRGKDNHSDD